MTKILKMDENNQCGNAMTKPFPTGSIKRTKELPTMREFDLTVQGISDTDKIGHLFIVDIEFDHKNATKNRYFLMKFIQQFLRKTKFCSPKKNRYSNSLAP